MLCSGPCRRERRERAPVKGINRVTSVWLGSSYGWAAS